MGKAPIRAGEIVVFHVDVSSQQKTFLHDETSTLGSKQCISSIGCSSVVEFKTWQLLLDQVQLHEA